MTIRTPPMPTFPPGTPVRRIWPGRGGEPDRELWRGVIRWSKRLNAREAVCVADLTSCDGQPGTGWAWCPTRNVEVVS